MKVSIAFRNIDPSDLLKSHVHIKLDKYDKLFPGSMEASVTILEDKFRHFVDVRLIGAGISVQAKDTNDDLYVAIDQVMDKLDSQIRKMKGKACEIKRTPISTIPLEGEA